MIDSLTDKEKNFIELALLLTIFALVLIIYKVSLIKKENNTVKNINSPQLVMSEINNQEIKQEELEQIIEEELSFLNKRNNINEITNQDKLSLALTILNNNMVDIPNTFTKEEIEDAFDKTCLSNLGIIHENIISIANEEEDGNPIYGYKYNDGVYEKENQIDSNFIKKYILNKKILSYTNNKNEYIISMGYLWSDPTDDINKITKIYGQNNEELMTIPEDVLAVSSENINKWINENYDLLKDKLDIYNYVFTKDNGKISLLDFYKN